MGKVNEQMDAKETAKVMAEFTKQNEYMNVKEDMLDDALMDAVRGGDVGGGWDRGCCVCGTFERLIHPLVCSLHSHPQFDGDGVEEEADSVVNQVLTEIGLDLGSKMADAPTTKLSQKEQEAEEDKAALAALEKLLPSMP